MIKLVIKWMRGWGLENGVNDFNNNKMKIY